MTVLYIILAVVLVLALMFAFVLISPLFVKIVYKDELSVYAGLSFVKFKVFPKDEKPKKKTKVKKTNVKKANKVHSGNSGSETTENVSTDGGKNGKTADGKQNKKSIKDTLLLILDVVKSVFEMMGKRASLSIDALKVVVSKPDAADTAVQFALCEGVVSTLLALSSEFAKANIKDENISVCPDFVTGKSSIEADISLSVPSGALLLSLIKGYLKNQFR